MTFFIFLKMTDFLLNLEMKTTEEMKMNVANCVGLFGPLSGSKQIPMKN